MAQRVGKGPAEPEFSAPLSRSECLWHSSARTARVILNEKGVPHPLFKLFPRRAILRLCTFLQPEAANGRLFSFAVYERGAPVPVGNAVPGVPPPKITKKVLLRGASTASPGRGRMSRAAFILKNLGFMLRPLVSKRRRRRFGVSAFAENEASTCKGKQDSLYSNCER